MVLFDCIMDLTSLYEQSVQGECCQPDGETDVRAHLGLFMRTLTLFLHFTLPLSSFLFFLLFFIALLSLPLL